MTLDKLLRGVRSLVLSSALAYSACGGGGGGDECERDSDCSFGRVCERDPETGERYCASPSEGEGERIPWYEGMCEDLHEMNEHFYPEGARYESTVITEDVICQQSCPAPREGIDFRYCVWFYCRTQVFDLRQHEGVKDILVEDEYETCLNSFGVEMGN